MRADEADTARRLPHRQRWPRLGRRCGDRRSGGKPGGPPVHGRAHLVPGVAGGRRRRGGGPGASADGIPIPWNGGVDCHFPANTGAATWKFRLPDGKLISGTKWWVRGDFGGSEAACRALRNVWPDLAAMASAGRAAHDSFTAKNWIDGSWSCVASHDMAAPGGGASISGFPSAACALIQYPGGGHLNAGYFLIWELNKVVIAQAHGYCLAGGSELASYCDLFVVADDALIGYPPVRDMSPPGQLLVPVAPADAQGQGDDLHG